MLGTFVLLHVSTFWIDAWGARHAIPATDWAIFIGLAFTGTYYFAASLVFPERPEEWTDLDSYYFENKRQVLVLVILLDMVNSALGNWLGGTFGGDWIAGLVLGPIIMVVAIRTKGKRGNLALLALLIVAALLSAVTGNKEIAAPGDPDGTAQRAF